MTKVNVAISQEKKSVVRMQFSILTRINDFEKKSLNLEGLAVNVANSQKQSEECNLVF